MTINFETAPTLLQCMSLLLALSDAFVISDKRSLSVGKRTLIRASAE
jgi:hypothetical protein